MALPPMPAHIVALEPHVPARKGRYRAYGLTFPHEHAAPAPCRPVRHTLCVVDTPSERAAEAAEVRIGYRLLGLGFQVTSEVGAGVGIGWLVDWFRGGGTTGVMIGGIAGVAVAMFTLIRGGMNTMKELDEIDKRRKRGG